MPICIRITHLTLKIQPIRPKMAPSTTNRRTRPIKRLKQRRGRRPIIRVTPFRETGRRADTQRMRDLVQGRPLGHVRAVGTEADIPARTPVRGRHAGVVLDRQGLCGVGLVGFVSGNGGVHCGLDLCVGVGLV